MTSRIGRARLVIRDGQIRIEQPANTYNAKNRRIKAARTEKQWRAASKKQGEKP